MQAPIASLYETDPMSEHLKLVRQNIRQGHLAQSLIDSLKKHPLIHFSDDADKIMTQGFLFGEPSVYSLDYSNHVTRSARGKQQPGYNFAFNATGYDEMNGCNDYEVATPQCERFLDGMYAKKAVLFLANGLYTRHDDDFQQVIFWGPAADLKHAVLFECESAQGTDQDEDELDLWTAKAADGTPLVMAHDRLDLSNCVAKVLLHLESRGALTKRVREDFRWCYADEITQLSRATAA